MSSGAPSDIPYGGAAANATRGAVGRVAAVQSQARTTLALAGVFACAAVVAALVPHRTGEWLPLHLFLAGSLLLAISGVTQLFAVTWAAGPPPADRLAAGQRWLLAGGVAILAAGRELSWPTAMVAVGGAGVIAALIVLAVCLDVTVRRGVQRRFDATAATYEVGLLAGVIGSALGVIMALGLDATVATSVRSAHLTLNLLGLIGLVIAGTLPIFTATQARTKINRRATDRAQRSVLIVLTVALGAATLGFLLRVPTVAACGLVLYAAGALALVPLLPTIRTKQLRWAGPRLLQLAAGVIWWSLATIAIAWRAHSTVQAFTPTTLRVLVVGGYAQIFAAALAYLVPVLRAGGHERLAAGFRTTRSWPGLVAANVAAVSFMLGAEAVAVSPLAVWLVDAVVRRVWLARRGATRAAFIATPGGTSSS
jgi:nitrite reductase (NO-forming)